MNGERFEQELEEIFWWVSWDPTKDF